MKERLRDGVTDEFWQEGVMVSDWYSPKQGMTVEDLYQAFKARMAREADEVDEVDAEALAFQKGAL